MKHISINFTLLLLYFISTINKIQCTCVLESDFGFIINCNFKNSGLFRVRNLGGAKAYIGLGFSLGDELGFNSSLGNVEGSRKRTLNLKTSLNAIDKAVVKPSDNPTSKIQQSRPLAVNPIVSSPQGFRRSPYMPQDTSLPSGSSTVPPFKPIPSETLQTNIQNVNDDRQNFNYGNQISLSEVPSFKGIGEDHFKINAQALTQDKEDDETLPQIDLKGHTIEELAEFANVTVDVIKAAIKIRQEQMKNAQKYYTNNFTKRKTALPTESVTQQSLATQKTTKLVTPAITHTTPKKKVTKYLYTKGHKVMNSPKEYYPSGYDKNFDDNFKSKVDLPSTLFHCGDQKHFPGLYADEDLGCMVFHVCALTDDGLIMKSFLCPESTLFDQTILKCNWWFYTDCKSSKALYDSNLPVSKSYQLMKSLAFFNANYKKTGNSTSEGEGIDVQSLRNSIN
ncbi:uncharacterized protein [Chironomus tepperi]|uniref:uncharacterized protein n=1 Tax=Chironomus tepperi TaxID=113505 RepID=UPI00391F0883